MIKSTLRSLAFASVFTAVCTNARDAQTLALVEQTYLEAKAEYKTNSSSAAADRKFASACFDEADNAANDKAREPFALEGIDVCQAWLQREPTNGAAHYYLGMNLAQLARTKTLGALSVVKQMEKEWLAALNFDAGCDYAGADRNLGLLYRDAPGFPISVGSKSKADEHLQHAIQLAPEYPENWINLIETHLKRKPSEVPDELAKLKAILPAARKQFSGPQWQSSWQDWDPRVKAIERKLAESQ